MHVQIEEALYRAQTSTSTSAPRADSLYPSIQQRVLRPSGRPPLLRSLATAARYCALSRRQLLFAPDAQLVVWALEAILLEH